MHVVAAGVPLEPELLRTTVDTGVGISAGHLTTVVRERTGRTVQDWIVDAKMTRARVFTRHHGMPPRRWRSRMTSAQNSAN